MKGNEELVSIVMNCFNSDKYLIEAIESVLSQDYANWELIFWDNQSTDNSAKIVKSYSDKRIKYFYSEQHTTLGEARNLASAKAKGSWIGFLDCDDKWEFNRLSILMEHISQRNHKLGFVFTRAVYFREAILLSKSENSTFSESKDVIDILSGNESISMLVPSIEFYHNHDYIFEKLLEAFYFPWVTVLINKQCFDFVGGFDNRYKSVEDYDILLKIAYLYEVCFIDKTTAHYRIHNSNISVEKTEESLIEAIELLTTYLPNQSALKGIDNNKFSLLRFYFNREKVKFLIYSSANPKLLLKFIVSNSKNQLKRIYFWFNSYFI